MRNMSFMITTQQFKNRTKRVTRRVGWWFLKSGDLLCGVEKSQGLKRGEKIVKLGVIRVVSLSSERLDAITQEDVILEGFPEMTPAQFVDMFCKSHKGCTPETIINRIAYEYVEEKQMELNSKPNDLSSQTIEDLVHAIDGGFLPLERDEIIRRYESLRAENARLTAALEAIAKPMSDEYSLQYRNAERRVIAKNALNGHGVLPPAENIYADEIDK